VCACMRACVRACVCVCACVYITCARAHERTRCESQHQSKIVNLVSGKSPAKKKACSQKENLNPAATRWRRLLGYIIHTSHFLQKSPINGGYFAERDLQGKASYGNLPPFTANLSPSSGGTNWLC